MPNPASNIVKLLGLSLKEIMCWEQDQRQWKEKDRKGDERERKSGRREEETEGSKGGKGREKEREGGRSEGRERMSFDLIPCDQLYSHIPKSLLPLPLPFLNFFSYICISWRLLKSPSSYTSPFLPGLLLAKAPTLWSLPSSSASQSS